MARRDKAGPGPRVRPEQATPQGAPSPEAGAGTKEQAGGTSGQSVHKVQIPAKEQAGTGRRVQAPHGKARGEAGGGKGQAGKTEAPQKARPRQTGGRGRWRGSVHGFVHGKIYEVEQENVGTEGAHHSELLGESAFRQGSRFVGRRIREHPARAVRRAEARYPARLRRTINFTPPPRNTRSSRKMPCPATGRNGGSASSTKSGQRRPPARGPWPLERPPPPPKSCRPRRWAL